MGLWRGKRVAAGLLAAMALPTVALGWLAQGPDYQGEPIHYLTATPKDRVAALAARMREGKARLAYEPKRGGYLPAVLRALGVPASSQTLVFSRTSFQRDKISPSAPRAVYFSDDVYVGYVQGGDVIEVSAVDPDLGAVFYTLPNRAAPAPAFARQTHECLQCHDTALAGGVPGHVMRSVYPDRAGNAMLSQGSFVTTDESPFRERWGGWYVTGRHGAMRHMGNVVARSENAPEDTDWHAGGNVLSLKKWVDTAPYLTPHSDIVALMVAEHQMRVQNLLTKANFGTRQALHFEAAMNRELKETGRREGTTRRIGYACEPLVKALLFCGEAALEAPVSGTSGFAAQFAAKGPRDPMRRSLRDFDLTRRLFRYPCSYLVYSDAFRGLPDPAREFVLRRLRAILTGPEPGKDFASLSDADRAAIHEILLATLPEYAALR